MDGSVDLVSQLAREGLLHMNLITSKRYLSKLSLAAMLVFVAAAFAYAQTGEKEGTTVFTGEEPYTAVSHEGAVLLKGHSLSHNNSPLKKNRYYTITANRALDDYCVKDKAIQFSFTDDVFIDKRFVGVCQETGRKMFDLWVRRY